MFCWGSSKHGVLGIGQGIQEPQYFPIKVIIDEAGDNSDQVEVLDLSAGKNHIGIICRKKTKTDESEQTESLPTCLYMWGSNKYG